MELTHRESMGSWEEFLKALKERGLLGVEYVVSDEHPGLKTTVSKLRAEVGGQRCYVHFLRNALDYLPRKAQDDCMTEMKWLYNRRGPGGGPPRPSGAG